MPLISVCTSSASSGSSRTSKASTNSLRSFQSSVSSTSTVIGNRSNANSRNGIFQGHDFFILGSPASQGRRDTSSPLSPPSHHDKYRHGQGTSSQAFERTQYQLKTGSDGSVGKDGARTPTSLAKRTGRGRLLNTNNIYTTTGNCGRARVGNPSDGGGLCVVM